LQNRLVKADSFELTIFLPTPFHQPISHYTNYHGFVKPYPTGLRFQIFDILTIRVMANTKNKTLPAG